VRSLPDGISLRELQAMEREYETSAQVIAMAFETMGLLVYEHIASFRIVQELAGGLVQMMWRKIGVWAEETRVEQGNPRFAEWVQWLAERMAEREEHVAPAHLAHTRWTPRDTRE